MFVCGATFWVAGRAARSHTHEVLKVGLKGRQVLKKSIIVIAVCSLAAVLVAPSASGSNLQQSNSYDPPDHCDSSQVWSTDGGSWSVYWEDLHSDPTREYQIYSVIEGRMSTVYDPHMIYVTHTSYQWTTDAVIHAGPYADWQYGAGSPTGWCGKDWAGFGSFNQAGYVTCDHLAASGVNCDQHLAYFDHEDIDPARSSLARHWACHELAHTHGLRHRSGDCVSQTGSSTILDSHNTGHLGEVYS